MFDFILSGAESFIAGTANCQVGVDGIDELYHIIKGQNILHPSAHIGDRPWGVRDFAVVDPDNNLITFFERLK